MKVSGFTFLRNAQQLGFPFVESIRSILPICDEFVIAVGKSTDATLPMIQAINDPKIKIIETVWNDNLRAKGYVYAEQKMIAQFACSGDWAFYLEADEVIHEEDLPNLVAAMQRYQHDEQVEALVLDYLNFYGNINTWLRSPRWIRRAVRVIKRSVRCYAPDGSHWLVLTDKNKHARYPRAGLANARVFHYGWVRSEKQMIDKLTQVEHFWNKKNQAQGFSYQSVDPKTLHLFNGTHPKIIADFFPQETGIFQADPHYHLSRREYKHRVAMLLEKYLKLDFTREHFELVKSE